MIRNYSNLTFHLLYFVYSATSLQRQLRPPGTPDPRNPAEYCSTVPPTQQASQTASNNADVAVAEPPSVMVPVSKSSLRRPTSEGLFSFHYDEQVLRDSEEDRTKIVIMQHVQRGECACDVYERFWFWSFF